MEETPTEDSVRDFLDNVLTATTDLTDKIDELEMELEDEKINLENQLLLLKSQNSDGEEKRNAKVKEFTESANSVVADIDSVIRKTSSHLTSSEEDYKTLKKLVSNVRDIEKCSNYFAYIVQLEEISSFVQSSMLIENIDQAVNQFSSLVSLASEIKDSNCVNLCNYVHATVGYWYTILISSLSGEMEKSLQAFGWPFIVTSVKPVQPVNAVQLKDNFAHLIDLLMKIQLPEFLSGRVEQIFKCNEECCRLFLPMQFFMVPFKTRFLFHFYGNKKTNNTEKPEWYFTQVNLWLNDHRDFLVDKLQPIFNEAGYSSVNVLSEFVEGLVHLVSEKLRSDLTKLLEGSSQNTDQLVAHHVDEALAFHAEISSTFTYPEAFFGCLEVLTERGIFEKWISVEKEYALRKMDLIISMNDAWNVHSVTVANDNDDAADNNKIPQFAELFFMLMATIQDRYTSLPSPDCQLEFSHLQLYLVDDFRIRLFQIKKQVTMTTVQVTENTKYALILNTVSFMVDILKRWADDPFYVKLSYHKRKTEAGHHKGIRTSSKDGPNGGGISPSGLPGESKNNHSHHHGNDLHFHGNDISSSDGEPSLFDGMIELYERMKMDMMGTICQSIFEEFKIKSKIYRRDKWLALPSHKEFLTLALSNSACSMLRSLKDNLDSMETLLNKSLFTVLWQRIAQLLNEFIFENIICANHFNEGGAMQLNFDMNRNLFPIFSHYTNKPENFFKSIKEACLVLALSPGSAMLIRDVLKRALNPSENNIEVSDPIAALHDIAVYKLEPEQVEFLISLRIDLQQN